MSSHKVLSNLQAESFTDGTSQQLLVHAKGIIAHTVTWDQIVLK